jgi:hypothetical protein
MSEDVRDEDTVDESEDQTDRRDFLKQAGMIGGGALAALAGLASAADAQQDIRTRPRANLGLGPGGAPISGPFTIEPGQVASVSEFENLFAEMNAAYPPETSPEMAEEAGAKMTEMMADMSPPSKVAAVAIWQMRRRFKGSPNVGQNLVVLFSTLAAGMEQEFPGLVYGPRALGSGCGDGCGSGCGSGCMSAVAGGFGCGNGCGNNCNGADAAGLMCGGGCEATGLEQLSFDRKGAALEGVKFKGLNIGTMAAAMRNADRAYNESGLASAPADKPDW